MRLREPLLLPLAAVCSGILAAHFTPFTWQEILPFALGAALLAAASCRAAPFSSPLAALCSLALVAAAFGTPHPPKTPRLTVDDGQLAIFEGCVVNPALPSGGRERFDLELAPAIRAQVVLFTRKNLQIPALPYGTRIEFTGRIRPIHNFNNPGSFDALRYFARRQVYWTASGDVATLKTLPGFCGVSWERPIFALRAAALQRLESLYPDDPYTAGMLAAVLLGETSRMERLWTEDYRSTGTYHALVISGSHVAVLAAVLLLFLRLLWVPQWAALSATISVAWLYAGVTGWQAPVVRSAVGMSLYGVARIFYREGRLLNLLAGIALLFLVVDPSQLFEASFQLTFLAVAAIGAFAIPALEATSAPLAAGCRALAEVRRDIRLPPRTAQFRIELRLLALTLQLLVRLPLRVGNALVVVSARLVLYLWEIVVTSFIIQVALALPMIWYFHRLSFSGLTANVMVLPALTAVVPLGFLAITLNSHPLAVTCRLLLGLSKWAAAVNARWEPEWRIPPPPLWLALLFAALLLFAAWRRVPRLGKLSAWVAILGVLAAIALHTFPPKVQPGRFELDALDVGQGDSLLATFPSGQLMLIDAGGIPAFGLGRKSALDVGEDVVAPYLWSRAIRHLDVVVMSHAHEDHMGGMPAILRNFHPAELWTGAVAESPEWQNVRTAALRYGVRIRQMRRHQAFAFGGTSITILAPGPDYVADIKPKNDDSLVLRIDYQATSFLLAGDMEKRTERELISADLLQPATVLKVGHHGSKTSSTPEFLDLVQPSFALISAGFENSYGHPHPTTLESLNAHHTRTLRTDQLGLLRVSSDGRRIRLD